MHLSEKINTKIALGRLIASSSSREEFLFPISKEAGRKWLQTTTASTVYSLKSLEVLEKITSICAYVCKVPGCLVRVCNNYICINVEIENLLSILHIGRIWDVEFFESELHRSKEK